VRHKIQSRDERGIALELDGVIWRAAEEAAERAARRTAKHARRTALLDGLRERDGALPRWARRGAETIGQPRGEQQLLVLEVSTDQAELVRTALLRWGELTSAGSYTVPAGDGGLISVSVVDEGMDLEGVRRRLAVMRVGYCHPLEGMTRGVDAELYERMLAVRAALEHAENRIMEIEVQNRDLTWRLKQP